MSGAKYRIKESKYWNQQSSTVDTKYEIVYKENKKEVVLDEMDFQKLSQAESYPAFIVEDEQPNYHSTAS